MEFIKTVKNNIFELRRLWLLFLLPISFILIIAARNNQNFAEWYATTVYPKISILINKITSLVPISLAEIILIMSVISGILFIILSVVYIIKNKGYYILNIIKFFVNILCIIGVLSFLFTILCGINYYRMTFPDKIGLYEFPLPKSELIELCDDLSIKANSLKELSNDIGIVAFDEITQQAQESYNNLDNIYISLISGYGRAKPIFLSRLMSYGNITGFFFPYTFEANVNIDIPSYSIPSTVCHELAHLRGYMREDEANFIAYLICINSNSPILKYSGVMMAFIYATNALYRIDKEAYSKEYQSLSDNVKNDLQTSSDYWSGFDGPIAKVSDKINDTYLKANNQKDGVESYGRMVDLLLADYLSNKALN